MPLSFCTINSKSFPNSSGCWRGSKTASSNDLDRQSQNNIEPSKKGRELSKQEVNKLKEVLKHDVYKAQGKTTFKEEFVTCGGIQLDQIDSKTMEAKNHKGLFFAAVFLVFLVTFNLKNILFNK